MRKLAILVAGVAALAASAVLAVSASASTEHSTVGGVMCEFGGSPGTPDDGIACEPPSPITGDFNGFSPSHHCENLLYRGPTDDWSQRPGNRYYTIGDPYVATDFQHNAAAEGDCDNDIIDGDTTDDDSQASYDTIVVLRHVFYFNEAGFSGPSCGGITHPDRNPGCPDGTAPGEDAYYIGLLAPNGTWLYLIDLSAGFKGEIPTPG